ncbi:aldehyde dehydrogenase [Schaedlerella arabinosiphila]|uniref:Aldehyde dehydrogenase n=1 Tax=Schaedlerella arabinosiphila TaxID=2044587 RepID=A0A426DPG0_9FIRM|nr:glyceraldehyde-3-phosphate dehydrogenase [Schaedlerella arabinosiphila]RRK34571.1 aldehyde dehydrogenase [Schaedlerella arabinosiphila]
MKKLAIFRAGDISADMSVALSKESSKSEIIELLNQIVSQVVSLNTEDIISIDCRKSSFSSIVEKRWVTVEGNKLKLITWYDNEWGYCSRVIDLISRMDF